MVGIGFPAVGCLLRGLGLVVLLFCEFVLHGLGSSCFRISGWWLVSIVLGVNSVVVLPGYYCLV